MTKAFDEQFAQGQDSIRFGREVPADDVNIAYVHTPSLEAGENVELSDLSTSILANYWGDQKLEYLMFPGMDHKLRHEDFTGDSVPTKDILITDRFIDNAQKKGPLYYYYDLTYLHAGAVSEIEIIDDAGNPVPSSTYKVNAVSAGPNLSEVRLELGFNSDEDKTYFVIYKAVDRLGHPRSNHSEVINASPIFTETNKVAVLDPANKNKPIYAVEVDKNSSSNAYHVYVPVAASTTDNPSLYDRYADADLGVPFQYAVNIAGFKRSEYKGIAVHFVMDRSGSMRGSDQWTPMKDTVRYFKNLPDVNCIFNVTYFSSSCTTVWSNYVNADTVLNWSPPSSSGNTALYTATRIALEKLLQFDRLPEDHPQTLKGWKKVVIFLTDGYDNSSSKNDSPAKVNKFGHDNMAVDIWGIGVGSRIDWNRLQQLADPGQVIQTDSMEEAFQQIRENTTPIPFENRILSGSGVVTTALSPLRLRQLLVNVDDNIMIESVKITLSDTSDLVSTYFYDEANKVNLGSEIRADQVLEFNEATGSWQYKNNQRIYVYASTNHKDKIYTKTYSVKLKRYRGIYARMPNNLDPFENWYLQVHSGRFQLETRDSNESTLYTYYLPEHLAQMSVEGALINVTDEIPQVIDDTTLQLADSPLYVEVDFDQNGQRIITNLTVTSDGKEIKVADYNAAAGIVYLAEHIDHTTDIRVDYTYKNSWYEYRGYYDESKDYFVHLDLNPFEGHTYSAYQSNNTYVERPTKELFNQVIYLYIRPAETRRLNPNGQYVMVPGSRQIYTLFHRIGRELTESDPMYTEQVQKLAKIYVKPNSNRSDITVIDTRQRGGGLKESISQDLIDKFEPEANYYWDIGFLDGKAYPGNSVVIVRLPKTILKEHGGRFTESEVEAAVDKHIAFGSYYIIEYVDPEDYLPDEI